MLKYVSFLSLCFLILMSLSFINMVHSEEVIFPDPNLEAAIREALDKPTGPITDEDLATLTELGASERGIIDLTGIEYCINLQQLYLLHNQISNSNRSILKGVKLWNTSRIWTRSIYLWIGTNLSSTMENIEA